ncbi:MAG: hypothetical protein F6K48_30550, partial [Okeania sp. SIO3H1]|nr:hypothetical protein [Okeania sp. SIO3H1]
QHESNPRPEQSIVKTSLEKQTLHCDRMQAMPRPFVYAFYSTILGGTWLALFLIGSIPGLSMSGLPQLSNVTFPTLTVVALSFMAGYTIFMALVSLFDALKHADASNVMPIVGSVSAMATFGMSYLFLDAQLSTNFIYGVIVLSAGTLLVAQTLPKADVTLHVVHSGLFFALHAITMKGLFLETSFDDGLFWSRVGFVLFALSLLLVPTYLKKITTQTKSTNKKTGGLMLGAKLLAGVAAFLLLKATDLGEVSVVQALDGLKFVFILLITAICAHWLPSSATDRDTRPGTIFRKLLFVIVIMVGFLLLFA